MFAKQCPLTRARPHAFTAGRQRLESVLRKWVAYNSKLVTACPDNKAASFSAGGVGTPMNALWGGEGSASCYWQGVDALATVILRAVDGHVARATEMLTSLIASRFSSLFSEGPRQVLHWQLCVCCLPGPFISHSRGRGREGACSKRIHTCLYQSGHGAELAVRCLATTAPLFRRAALHASQGLRSDCRSVCHRLVAYLVRSCCPV